MQLAQNSGKNIKDDRKRVMFWLFCSHYDIEQYAAKSYCSKVLQDHLLAEQRSCKDSVEHSKPYGFVCIF